MSDNPPEYYKSFGDFDELKTEKPNEKEVVDNYEANKQEVDIKAFFEKPDVNEKLSCEVFHALADEENAANRRQRRLNQRLYWVTGILVIMFFVGLIFTVIGSLYLSKVDTKVNEMGEHHSSAEPLVKSNIIEPFIEFNASTDDQIDPIDLSNVFSDLNDISPPQTTLSSTTAIPTPATKRIIATTEFDYMPFERQLEELAPDNSLQRFLNSLRSSRVDLRLNDVPPAVDDMLQYMRRFFRLPEFRFEYQ